MPAELLFAGKYAAFVLPAYGVTILGVAGAIAFSWCSYRAALRRISKFENAMAAPMRSDTGARED